MQNMLITRILVLATLVLGLCEGAPASDEFHEKRLIQQERDLQELGCKPALQAVSLADHLERHDDLADKMFFPQVVAVRKCSEKCSFCGSSKLGRTRGICVPVPEAMVPKEFVVFFYDGVKRRYRKVVNMEHTQCQCTTGHQ